MRIKLEPSQLKMLRKLKTMDQKNTLDMQELINLSKEFKENEREYESKNISNILILNKMDLVNNKRRLRELQEELEDLGIFDKIFHISALTGNINLHKGYGMNQLISYLKEEAFRRPWTYHSDVNSTLPEVEKCQEILRQNIYNKFYFEVPYQCGCKLSSWVPKSNGELDLVFHIEVKNRNIIGIVLGEKGNINYK